MMGGTAGQVLSALEKHGLKKDGANRFRANSPFRTGSDSMSFSLVIEGDEKGAYKDFVSDDSGSLYDLAKHLGIATPQRQPVTSTKRVYSGLADYATAHGVTADDLAGWFWRETVFQDRIALEYQTRTGKRWRFLDGQKPYYKSETGYKRCWYGLGKIVAERVKDGQPLIICNGEISTIAAQKVGLAAVAVTGGEQAIPPELIDDLTWAIDKDKCQIIVALDCDSKGKAAAAQVMAQFRAQGFAARAVDLGLGHNGDLADFCMLHKDKSAAALMKLPTLPDTTLEAQTERSWVIIPARDLKNLPKVSWLVDGAIPAYGLTVIYGPSGVGKSFLALDYALTIAQEKTVVYVAAEGESGYGLRVAAWCKKNQKAEANLYMCLGSPNLMDDADLEAFIHAISNLSPVMCVVDTLAMAMIGADENSARDMGRIIMACRSLQREAHCAVVLVHHTNKGGTVERGSGALRGAADSMIRVTGDDDLILIDSTKSKDTAAFETRYMKMIPVLIGLDESRVLVRAEAVDKNATDKLSKQQRIVLETLALEVFLDDGASASDLSETTDIGRGALYRLLSRLMGMKLVEQPVARGNYKITDAGKQKLNDSMTHNDSASQDDSPIQTAKTRESIESLSHSGEIGHLENESLRESSRMTQLKLLSVPTKTMSQYDFEV